MKTKKLLPLGLLIILISATFVTLHSAATTEIEPATDIIGDQKESNEVSSQTINQEYSKTTLEYLVNKTTDPSLNNTIIDPNIKRDLDYNEREPQQIIPDLNGTTNKILFVNESIISFSSSKTTQAKTDDIVNSNANDDFIIDSWDSDRPPVEFLPPTKNGHYFPNMDHSRIRYQIFTPLWYIPYNYQFRLDIVRVEDIWARYFRIYWDNSMVYEQIIGAEGYNSDFWITASQGTHRLEFEIWSGYYSDHAWRIDLFRAADVDLQDPINPVAQITGEFFPFQAYSQLRWIVEMGQQTWAEVKIDRVDDPYWRDLKFFVDGVQKEPGMIAPCDITFSLGSYTQGSIHEIMLEVSWCNYMEWGYIMPKFRVSYGGAAAEVDYLVCNYGSGADHNHAPDASALNYLQVYFVEHGYQRYSLLFNDGQYSTAIDTSTLPNWNDNHHYYDVIDDTKYDAIKNQYFDLHSMYGVNYVLFGHYAVNHTLPNNATLGWANVGGPRIFIADRMCDDYAAYASLPAVQVQTVVLMHECGHSVHIYESSGGQEAYCNNSYCVMARCGADNCDDYPWYCDDHWSLRDFPDF